MGIDQLLNNLPFRGYVSLDGAHVVLDGKVILDCCFPRAVLERMVAEMLRVGMPAFFEGTELCLELNASGGSLYNWGPVACDLEEMRSTKPDLRFAKVDFVDEAYGAYRASDFLMEELGYYNVGEGSHELVMPGVSKGAGARPCSRSSLLRRVRRRRVSLPSVIPRTICLSLRPRTLPWRWARQHPMCARPPTTSRSPVQTTASPRPWNTSA